MQTTLTVIGSLLLALLLLNVYSRWKMKQFPPVSDNNKIVTLTNQNFPAEIKNKVVLVDFWAEWCMPCRMMAPVLNDVTDSLSGNMKVGKVNIELYKELAQQFNVMSIPTMILFKNGKEINRFVGVKTKDFLLAKMIEIK
jgi:thioredoxin 1